MIGRQLLKEKVMKDDDVESFLNKIESIRNRLWWIALWLFIIAMNSCDIKDNLSKLIK